MIETPRALPVVFFYVQQRNLCYNVLVIFNTLRSRNNVYGHGQLRDVKNI